MNTPVMDEAMASRENQSNVGSRRRGIAQLIRKFALTCQQRILGLSNRPARRLRLCESLGLGDRRFVAVVEFDERRFLVGGTSSSLVLLARLEDDGSIKTKGERQEACC
jgi:flagellar biogenesis protein FliO